MSKLSSILTIGVVLVMPTCHAVVSNATRDTLNAAKVEKTLVTSNGGHLVYTDKGTLKFNNSLWFGNFRAAEGFGHLQDGHTYDFDKYWFRWGLLGCYPNIISAKEITPEAK